jgi:hypothetical protein
MHLPTPGTVIRSSSIEPARKSWSWLFSTCRRWRPRTGGNEQRTVDGQTAPEATKDAKRTKPYDCRVLHLKGCGARHPLCFLGRVQTQYSILELHVKSGLQRRLRGLRNRRLSCRAPTVLYTVTMHRDAVGSPATCRQSGVRLPGRDVFCSALPLQGDPTTRHVCHAAARGTAAMYVSATISSDR